MLNLNCEMVGGVLILSKKVVDQYLRSLREERGGREGEKPPAPGVPACQSDVGASVRLTVGQGARFLLFLASGSRHSER